MDATDRTIVITGAGGGVGALLVRRFLDNGDTVLATDNNDAALDPLREDIGDTDRLITAAAEISDEDDTRGLAELNRRKTGRTQVLINCAGYFPIVPFEQIAAEDWRKVLEI